MTKGQVSRTGGRNAHIAPVALLSLLFLIGQAYWISDNRHRFAPFATQRITCDTCTGIGMVRDAEDNRILKMCSACFGVGSKIVRHFDENDVMCAACAGMGRLQENGAWRTCRRCEGRGLHRVGDGVQDWTELREVEAVLSRDDAEQPAPPEHAPDRD